MTKFRFFTKKELKQSELIKKVGIEALMTDFCVLLGGKHRCYVSEDKKIKNVGYWWLKSEDGLEINAAVKKHKPSTNIYNIAHSDYGARPILNYSLINKEFVYSENLSSKGIKEIEYGEYPQTIASEKQSLYLERAYLSGKINCTGKQYTINAFPASDSGLSLAYNYGFKEKKLQEYEYEGEKYIRLDDSDGFLTCENKHLSNGRVINYKDAYWVKVKPIKWLIDETNNIAISKDVLFAGIRFAPQMGAWDPDYENDFTITDISIYMEKYFSKDIIPSNIQLKGEQDSFYSPYSDYLAYLEEQNKKAL